MKVNRNSRLNLVVFLDFRLSFGEKLGKNDGLFRKVQRDYILSNWNRFYNI
jgi:hypothetical protein